MVRDLVHEKSVFISFARLRETRETGNGRWE